MIKGLISMAIGVALLTALSMSNAYQAIVGAANSNPAAAYILNAVPTAPEPSALLSYTCQLVKLAPAGSLCGF